MTTMRTEQTTLASAFIACELVGVWYHAFLYIGLVFAVVYLATLAPALFARR